MSTNLNTATSAVSTLIIAFLIFGAWLTVASPPTPIAPYCGDGICNGDENICSCSDCGTPPTPSCEVHFDPSVSIAAYPLTISGTSQNDEDGRAPYTCTGSLGSGVAPASGSYRFTTPGNIEVITEHTCTFEVENICGTKAHCSATVTSFPLTPQEVPPLPYEEVGFELPPRVTLTLKKAGSGSGNVSAIGVYCNDCVEDAATYFIGTRNAATAWPSEGSLFTGWSGNACSGAFPLCIFTMDEDKILIGNFELKNPPALLSEEFVFTASTTQETAITTANVNVRSAPSLTASIIRIVPSGILGTIIDGPVDADGYRWWKVFYASYGVTGWTADNWLKRTGEYQSDFVTATANLNVRSGPSLSAPVIGAVRAETHGIIVDGPVTADGYRWWKINFPGYDLVGWSADNWLERSEFTNIIPSSAEFKIGARVYNTQRLNIRSSPRLGLDNLYDTVQANTPGTIIDGPQTGDGFTWWKIAYDNGITGWSVEKWLKILPPQNPPLP